MKKKTGCSPRCSSQNRLLRARLATGFDVNFSLFFADLCPFRSGLCPQIAPIEEASPFRVFLFCLPFVAYQHGDREQKPTYGGNEEKNYCQPRITEKCELRRLHTHEYGCPDNGRRKYDSHCNAICDLLKPHHEVFFVNSIDANSEFIIREDLNYLSYPLGKVFDQFLRLHGYFIKICAGQALQKPFPEYFSGIHPDRCVRIEPRVQSSADIVEIQHAFAEHGQFGWETESRWSLPV